MAWTEVNQANKALALIGSSPISSLTDTGDPTAAMVDDVFDSCRDYVLESCQWPFAIKRADLTEYAVWVTATAYVIGDIVWTNDNVYTCAISHTSGTFATDLAAVDWTLTYVGPTFKWTNVYGKPSDMLKAIEVDDEDAEWAIEQDLIVADTAALELKYIFQVTDPAKWDTMFIDAFAAYLASEIAFALTSSKTTMEAMKALYERKVEEASSSDSQVGVPPTPRQDYWDGGRYIDE